MLDQLRNLNLDRVDIEDMVALKTFSTALFSGFSEVGLPVPEWIREKNEQLTVEIRNRRRDLLLREKKALQSEADKLRTPAERREDLQKRLAAIDGELNK